jgi:hypothetical protein
MSEDGWRQSASRNTADVFEANEIGMDLLSHVDD